MKGGVGSGEARIMRAQAKNRGDSVRGKRSGGFENKERSRSEGGGGKTGHQLKPRVGMKKTEWFHLQLDGCRNDDEGGWIGEEGNGGTT